MKRCRKMKQRHHWVFWKRVLTSSYCRWYSAFANQDRRAWISRYVREHILYALVVSQLSSRLAGPIYMEGYQTSYNHHWRCYFSWPLDLTCFFGVIGSNNDIIVLNQSALFVNIIRGCTPEVSFTVNGREHHMDTILPMVYIPPDRCSWNVSLFLNKRSINSSQWSKHRWEKMWSVLSAYWRRSSTY
jgi:hypothetical protein